MGLIIDYSLAGGKWEIFDQITCALVCKAPYAIAKETILTPKKKKIAKETIKKRFRKSKKFLEMGP